MCHQKRVTHEVCNHKDTTIQRCGKSTCSTFVHVDVRHPDFHIHLSSIENTFANDLCRSCRRNGFIARCPGFYLEEHQRIDEEMRLNLGLYIIQVRARVEATRARRRSRNHAANELLAACLPPAATERSEEDDRVCPICTQAYGEKSAGEDGMEDAVRMTCSHVIGRDCIVKILDAGNGECPFCRAKIGRE